MASVIHCAWCGQKFDATKNDRPKQHRNGAQVCPGSGQQRETHERLRSANAPSVIGRTRGGRC